MARVAAVDAIGIGAALFLLHVPLALSLAVLTFLSAFIPIIGATLAGAVATMVTLVTNGTRDALIILAVVILVQQAEGNLLQPIIMRRAVRLHPAVTLLAVSTGALVAGVAGALIAVPACAVTYHGVLAYRGRESAGRAAGAEPDAPPPPTGEREQAEEVRQADGKQADQETRQDREPPEGREVEPAASGVPSGLGRVARRRR